MAKKRQIRKSITYDEVTEKIISALADQWNLSENEVTQIMIKRGLNIEMGYRINYRPMFKTDDAKIIPIPDDRPRGKLPFSIEDLLNLINHKGEQS